MFKDLFNNQFEKYVQFLNVLILKHLKYVIKDVKKYVKLSKKLNIESE